MPAAAAKPATSKYFCPMCPGIESDVPGDCPQCGMALELNPRSIGNEEDSDAELQSITHRLLMSLVLTIPVFVFAMSHMLPTWGHGTWASSETSRWIQFLLSTPVVLWAGWPFFQRGWRSLRQRRLNMFTLVSLGVGAAYFFSAAAMLFPLVKRRSRTAEHIRHSGGLTVRGVTLARAAKGGPAAFVLRPQPMGDPCHPAPGIALRILAPVAFAGAPIGRPRQRQNVVIEIPGPLAVSIGRGGKGKGSGGAAKAQDDEGPQITRFVDLTKDFLNDDGTIKTELYTSDKIHLSPAGYAAYARRLRPLLP